MKQMEWDGMIHIVRIKKQINCNRPLDHKRSISFKLKPKIARNTNAAGTRNLEKKYL